MRSVSHQPTLIYIDNVG